MTLEVSNHT